MTKRLFFLMVVLVTTLSSCYDINTQTKDYRPKDMDEVSLIQDTTNFNGYYKIVQTEKLNTVYFYSYDKKCTHITLYSNERNDTFIIVFCTFLITTILFIILAMNL